MIRIGCRQRDLAGLGHECVRRRVAISTDTLDRFNRDMQCHISVSQIGALETIYVNAEAYDFSFSLMGLPVDSYAQLVRSRRYLSDGPDHSEWERCMSSSVILVSRPIWLSRRRLVVSADAILMSQSNHMR